MSRNIKLETIDDYISNHKDMGNHDYLIAIWDMLMEYDYVETDLDTGGIVFIKENENKH